MIKIKEKISTRKTLNHIIFNDIEISPKSYSSSILLTDYYKNLDISFQLENDWRYYFIVRRHFLRKKKKENGGFWICHYCGKKIYKLQERNNNKKQIDCITIDHIIPVSDDRCDKLDTSNMVECCYKCNKDKGNMDYNSFINTNK